MVYFHRINSIQVTTLHNLQDPPSYNVYLVVETTDHLTIVTEARYPDSCHF